MGDSVSQADACQAGAGAASHGTDFSDDTHDSDVGQTLTIKWENILTASDDQLYGCNKIIICSSSVCFQKKKLK